MRIKRKVFISPDFLALCGILLCATALWAPFGFRRTGLMEEWGFYYRFDLLPALGLRALSVPGQANRPLIALPVMLGYLLSPDSFVGLNVLLFVFTVGKVVLLYVLIRQMLPQQTLLAFFAVILYFVYPAEPALFSTRIINYQFAWFIFLITPNLLVLYWKQPKLLTLIGIWLFQFVCLAAYEAPYPVLLLTPLLLVWLQKGLNRRVLRIAALWYIVPLITLGWLAVTILQGGSAYQAGLLSAETLHGEQLVLSYLSNFVRMYTHDFIDSWKMTLESIQPNALFIALGLFVMFLTAFIGLYLSRNAVPKPNERYIRLNALLVVVGLAVIGLCYLPYMPLPHRYFTQYIFVFSSFGAALTIVAFLFLLGQFVRYKRLLIVLPISFITGLGAVKALQQHRQEVISSLNEQKLLASIVEDVPSASDGALILLLDDDTLLRGDFDMFAFPAESTDFVDAAIYLYDHPRFRIAYCDSSGVAWGGKNESCDLTSDRVILRADGVEDAGYSYDKTIFLQYDISGKAVVLDNIDKYVKERHVQEYNPGALIDKSAAVPRRVYTLLYEWPFNASAGFLESPPQNGAFIDFTSSKAPGRGWSEPESGGTWMGASTASLEFRLVPDDYKVDFRITYVIAPDVLASLRLFVADTQIPLTKTDQNGEINHYQGLIPKSLIGKEPDVTVLKFQVDHTVDVRDLGLSQVSRNLAVGFGWLRIEPQVP